ncbi:V8-like Glu-specific endopeptidase [Streptomyces sp. 2333.5]|uniref:trypsin-like serine peptidase n=1 Tax=Streptomyces TaxID=1883 RepID=UPI000897A414|nr:MULTISPECIES: trypsin-like serine protease [Streptomyces]PJJ03207.1 V8-like Glu-specific endopeptidase [Streptomyces sp. 2333.5]SED53396.1 V8-like Glu-specific endopeptidase [Streptomyces sp. 2314.4]SEE35538.1 V8-like Glu-specific endopeptidase [Streptomyces sp. 2112.2]SOE12435.1 V8-like Glu-specific endopeptidase [Streptomyces sp. 2323.1]
MLPLTSVVMLAAAVVGYATEQTDISSGSSLGRSGFGKSGESSQDPQDQDPKATAPADDGNAYTPRRTEQNARVGAVFEKDDSGDHFCTASVVQSPGRNMLITAAHCAYDMDAGSTVDDLVFAPDYRDGDEPTGLWKVKKVIVDKRWAKSQDEDLDVAFLVLDKKSGKQIQDVLGGNTLGIDRGFDNDVKITGYPTSRNTPISCQNRTTKFSDTQLRIQCTDFEGGTSGSPWLADYDPKSHTGTVIGVLGGHEGGGDEDDVSYAAYFDDDIAKLYKHAQDED